MNDQEKLKEIHNIANNIWNWMCELSSPMVALIPPIERIRELSQTSEGAQ